MKKSFATVIGVMSLAAIVNVPAYADGDGIIYFNGNILDTACQVDTGAGNILNVNMGDVSKTSFVRENDVSSATRFTIKLKDCPLTVQRATVKFDGIHYNGDNTLLALTENTTPGGQTAGGVAIQLTDASNTVVPLYTASSAYNLSLGDNSLDFVARYIAKSIPVTPGSANSVATFTLNYN